LNFKRLLADRTDISVSTKNKYLASTRIFLKELSRLGTIPDITVNIKCFKQDKKHKRIGLNDYQVKNVWETINQSEINFKNTRLKAILSLLIFQGLRQIEIIRLNVADISLETATAMIKGKGRDDKEQIDLHPETITALKSYLFISKIADGSLFTCKSNNHLNKRLTTRSIRNLIKNFLLDLGINKTTHGFRHYFTTTLIKQFKGDLLEVAQYTRHQSLEMLQIYNDRVKKESDLPKYYNAFQSIME
jgi:integrase